MKLDTLIDDIYHLFDPKVMHTPSEENLTAFCDNMKELLRTRLASRENLSNPLRFSSLGKPDCQLWWMAQGVEPEDLSPKTYFKFLYGDVIEQLILFLAKEAGHDVSQEQAEVEVDGVKGHIDAVIDGYVVDVKSASPFGYKKFKEGSLLDNDPFGYVRQLSGYTNVLTPDRGGYFLAFDKVSGDICLSPLSVTVTSDNPPAPRIEHLKAVISSPEPPPRCFSDHEDGKSGNRKLGTECSYCSYKHHCWPGLRTFAYSNGPRFLTKVVKEPDVYEVKDGE